MNYIGRLWSNISGYYSDINQATLTGAIDVIIIEHEDGTYRSTPLYVRFGKADILRPKNNQVELYVNGEFISDIPITLGPNGEGYIGKPLIEDSIKSDMKMESDEHQEPLFVIDDLISCDPSSNSQSTSLDTSKPKAMCKSDSELNAVNEDADDFDWNWGQRNFTQRRKSISKRNQALRRVDQSQKPPLSVDEKDDKKIRKEIYLSDIRNSIEKNLYLYNNASPPKTSVKRMVANATNARGFSHAVRSLPLDSTPEFTEFCLSLCGGLDNNHEPSLDQFMEHLIIDQDFHSDPWSILNHPDLVIRWEGHYYSWKMVAPLIVSFLAFQKPLPDDILHRLSTFPPEKISKRQRVSSWLASWGLPAAPQKTATSSKQSPDCSPQHTKFIDESNKSLTYSQENTKSNSSSQSSDTPALGSSLPDRPDYSLLCPPSNLNTDVCYSESDIHLVGTAELPSQDHTIHLTSEQIKLLNLSYGANPVVYSFTSQYRGTSQCSCYFYLWKHTDKIIISDIDGTITKSDVLGHIFPLVGKDWTQSGIVKLYDRIQDNNYRFVYLSARAIGQAGFTRAFLQNVRQDNLRLPDGAVLLSPCSLVKAFRQEVIEKKPEAFKIACLRDLQSVFQPVSTHVDPIVPFHAGFGNKETDVKTYKSLGIDPKLIFTVNKYGQLRNELDETSNMTYEMLNEVVNQYFPLVEQSYQISTNIKKISEFGVNEEDEAFVDSKNGNGIVE